MTDVSYSLLGKKITNCLIENTGGQVFTSGPTIKTLIEDADRLYKNDGIWSSANFVMEGIENDDREKFDKAKDFLVETLDYSQKTTGKNKDYLNLAIKLTGLGHMDMFKVFNIAQTLLIEGMFKKYATPQQKITIFDESSFNINNPPQRPVLSRDGIITFLNEHGIEFTQEEIDEFITIAKFEDSEYSRDQIGEVEFYHNVHAHYIYSNNHDTAIIKKVCNLAQKIWDNANYYDHGLNPVPSTSKPPSESRPSDCISENRAALERWIARTIAVVDKADEIGTQVLVDAEQTYIQKTLDSLTRQLQTKYHDNKTGFILNGYQSYLKATPEHIKLEMERCHRVGIPFGIKLIRGAYMGEERKLASAHGYESPIWDNIDDTHRSYNTNLKNILKNLEPEKGKYHQTLLHFLFLILKIKYRFLPCGKP